MNMTASEEVISAPIRIVIADDHPIFCQGLCLVLQNENGLRVVGQAADGNELIRVVEEQKPDVVLTDIRMPGMDGVEATKIIVERYPHISVIALTVFDSEKLALDMLEAGATGYLLKTANKEELIQAICNVHQKGTFSYCAMASNKLVRLMARSSFNPYHLGKKPHFTDRELEIIRLLCQELCSKEIAEQLNMNSRSVETARERIQEKIGARNMIGIAVYAIRNGIYCLD